MKLNEVKGNMYDFITHTGNAIKGECPHNCSYCYMKRWGKQKPVHLDLKELKEPLPENNFIFIGSSCDMFADKIKTEDIFEVLEYLKFSNNRYLFQSKNPHSILAFENTLPSRSVICTTIETNRFYPEIMGSCPKPIERAESMAEIYHYTYVTIEPIIDFDLKELISLIKMCRPQQVNIGADSGNNHLPEPPKEKIMELISELQKFTIIHNKSNLKRILR